MQVIALVLAFTTRKVKVKGLDDAKYIAAAIYVTSIVLAVIIVATYSLKDFVNAFPTLFCTGFIIGTTSILGLVFVPKVERFVRQVMSLVSVYVLGFTYKWYVASSQLQIHWTQNSEATHTNIYIHVAKWQQKWKINRVAHASSKRVSYWVYINLHHRYQHMHPLVL